MNFVRGVGGGGGESPICGHLYRYRINMFKLFCVLMLLNLHSSGFTSVVHNRRDQTRINTV